VPSRRCQIPHRPTSPGANEQPWAHPRQIVLPVGSSFHWDHPQLQSMTSPVAPNHHASSLHMREEVSSERNRLPKVQAFLSAFASQVLQTIGQGHAGATDVSLFSIGFNTPSTLSARTFRFSSVMRSELMGLLTFLLAMHSATVATGRQSRFPCSAKPPERLRLLGWGPLLRESCPKIELTDSQQAGDGDADRFAVHTPRLRA